MTEITVRVLPASEPDVVQATQPRRLQLYDWEPNVLGARGPDQPYSGTTALFDAVQVAQDAEPRAEETDFPPGAPEGLTPQEADRRNDSTGERFYLFDRENQLLAGPAPSRAGLGARLPADAEVLVVPQGIVVVEGERAPNQPEEIQRFFVLEDDSELSGSDIENPEQNVDQQTQEPVVTMEFTDEGRQAFANVTQRIAERGAEQILPPGAPPEVRDATLQRFAITLDNEIVSLATIDYRENPEGIDGRTGAQINGIGGLVETRRLATLLESEALPADLRALPALTVRHR